MNITFWHISTPQILQYVRSSVAFKMFEVMSVQRSGKGHWCSWHCSQKHEVDLAQGVQGYQKWDIWAKSEELELCPKEESIIETPKT